MGNYSFRFEKLEIWKKAIKRINESTNHLIIELFNQRIIEAGLGERGDGV
jgi:hypothetical protein